MIKCTNRFLVAVIGLVSSYCVYANAALISRTYTYTSGNTISANENNTNENTIYTEFNGNIESANIKDGTIVNADISDTTIDKAKFTSAVQSTFTYIATRGYYRRPVVSWINVATVDVENNTGTSNETCIQFPDERRCVTENTSSTSVNRRFISNETASFSGTKNSGMSPGETVAANTWYALYAVKVQDNSTDFVLAASTNTPSQANYASLNTLFGTNGWVYLEIIRNGNNSGMTTGILKFKQTGNFTLFLSSTAANNAFQTTGTLLATTGGATSLTYTYTAGTGATSIPSNITNAVIAAAVGTGPSGTVTFTDAGGVFQYFADTVTCLRQIIVDVSSGFKLNNGSSIRFDIALVAFWDTSLGVGYNPQL